MNPNPNSNYIDTDDVDHNIDYLRQDAGGMITNHNGLADKLLQNDKLYNSMKGDWTRTDWNGSKNILITTGRKDGKFYITREQFNVDKIRQRAQEYRRDAEAGIPDPLAPLMPDGKLGWKWMDLPDVIAIRISDDYFGGMPWGIIKHDKTLKAQFYRVVQREYPAFITYPGGKLPIPVDVPYPAKMGEAKFFKGN
jgi:hypothetical protein